MSPKSWKTALEAVVGRWHGTGKLVLVLDEFQWMVEASPELPSVLQELWDREWRGNGRVMLILCGSYVGFMEREVLGSKSPLFGRRTAQIQLQPFDLREARRFHPSWSLADAARVRFVVGGVPLYLRAFDEHRSFEDNLRDTLFDEFAPLFREPEFLLREQLRDVTHYSAILAALATGSLPGHELAERSGVPERNLPYYLGQLTELGYVRRRWPLDGRPPSPRRVRWGLCDPLLRFWFRFVFPHMSAIRQLGPERAMSTFVRPQLASWCGVAFEELCREALPWLYSDEGVAASWEIGEYWDRGVQIDVVGLRSDEWTDLAECRWGEVPSRPGVVAELKEKAAKFPNTRGATLGLRVFAREAPPAAEVRKLGVRWHGLRDIYGE
jgi:hypothetical protein